MWACVGNVVAMILYDLIAFGWGDLVLSCIGVYRFTWVISVYMQPRSVWLRRLSMDIHRLVDYPYKYPDPSNTSVILRKDPTPAMKGFIFFFGRVQSLILRDAHLFWLKLGGEFRPFWQSVPNRRSLRVETKILSIGWLFQKLSVWQLSKIDIQMT